MALTHRIAAWLTGAALLVAPIGLSSAAVAGGGIAMDSSTTARVTAVVDGDTIRTTKGTIRVIGIDTPEAGECNFARAKANARRITPVGSVVRLTLPNGQNNTDDYGRKLRYVTRNGVDLGGAQIKAGLADARYDSRDGFPRHPKESDYRSWDARYRDRPCGGGGGASGGKPGKYTGCRAYGPEGTSTDDEGRRYTKIDCKTRKPL